MKLAKRVVLMMFTLALVMGTASTVSAEAAWSDRRGAPFTAAGCQCRCPESSGQAAQTGTGLYVLGNLLTDTAS